jgi:hypothetical protein
MPQIDTGYSDGLKTAYIQRAFISINRDQTPLGASNSGYRSQGVIAGEQEIRDGMVSTQPSAHRAELQNAIQKRTMPMGGIMPVSGVPQPVYKWKN